MAIIQCPECKRDISDKTGNCPHCGFPVYLEITGSKEKKRCPYCDTFNDYYAVNCKSCNGILPQPDELEDDKYETNEPECSTYEFEKPQPDIYEFEKPQVQPVRPEQPRMSRPEEGRAGTKKRFGLCQASILCSVIGLLLTCIAIGFIPAVAGLALGIVALCLHKEPAVLAIGGIVISALALTLFTLLLIIGLKETSAENAGTVSQSTVITQESN